MGKLAMDTMSGLDFFPTKPSRKNFIGVLSHGKTHGKTLSLWIQTLSEKVLNPPNYSKLYPKHFLRRYLDP